MIKNLLILLVLCAVVLFGGKYYVEKRYEKELDKVISTFGVKARYDNIEVGFDGSLALNGLRITPPKHTDDIRFGTIKLLTSDRFAILRGRNAFGDGKYPDSVSIKVDNLDFNPNLVETGTKKQHCRGLASSLLYSEIGEERIRADMDFSMDFSEPYNAVIDVYYSDTIGTADIQWVLDIEGVAQAMTSDTEAPIREFTLSTELNPSAATSIAEYCAGIFEVSTEEFLVKVAGSPKFSSNSFGADLGPKFRDALVTYLRGGVTAKMRSEPSKQLLKLSNAKFFKPRDVLRWLNLTVFLDGELIPMTIVKEKQIQKKSKSEPARKLAKYQVVEVSQVARYVDKDVKVSRSKGRKPIKGRLLSVKNGLLAIESYRYTGQMTLKVPTSDIAELEVLVRGTTSSEK